MDGPQVSQGLSLGIDLGMIFQSQWRACSRLWPAQQRGSLADAAHGDGGERKAAAAKQHLQQRQQRPGGPPIGKQGRRRLRRLLASPLLPFAGLNVAAAAALGLAVTTGSLLLRCVASYAAAELAFQSYQCLR